MAVAIQFRLETAGYDLTGSPQQYSIIHELHVIDIFCASGHPNSGEILLKPGIFQLKSKYRILDGIKQRGEREALPQTSQGLEERSSSAVD